MDFSEKELMTEDSIRRGNQIRTNLNVFDPETSAIVYSEGGLDGSKGKTTHRLIRHSDLFNIVGVIDSEFEGKCVGDADSPVLQSDIPVFTSVASATETVSSEVFIIGTAPLGGGISDELLTSVEDALNQGLDIISGLHEHISEKNYFTALAEQHDCQLYDLRKAPPESQLSEADGRPNDLECTVVTVMGTDCVTGKGTTTYELYRAAKTDGLNSAFVATGQTGILAGSSYGLPTDKISTEYAVGAIEDVVYAAAADHDWVFVEGQAALSHPRFVGDDILKGSQPDFVVLADKPSRDTYVYFDRQKAGAELEIKLIESIVNTEVIAISSWNVDLTTQLTQRDIIVANVIEKNGANRILDEIKNQAK